MTAFGVDKPFPSTRPSLRQTHRVRDPSRCLQGETP